MFLYESAYWEESNFIFTQELLEGVPCGDKFEVT